MNHLAYNSGPFGWYLIVNNIYYHRDYKKGWYVIPAEQAPALELFSEMHEKQVTAYTEQLRDQGLIE